MNHFSSKPKNKKVVRDIRAEAAKIANSIKIEGQSKAESAAIAHGIQRGMDQFLRQQSEKARDLDKRVKKVKQMTNNLADLSGSATTPAETSSHVQISQRLPWLLLLLSWILFVLVAYWLTQAQ
jgi:hypothetical protein